MPLLQVIRAIRHVLKPPDCSIGSTKSPSNGNEDVSLICDITHITLGASSQVCLQRRSKLVLFLQVSTPPSQKKNIVGKKTESLKYYVFLKKKKKRLLGINFHTTSINKERDLEFQSSVLFLCACFMQCLTIIKDNS